MLWPLLTQKWQDWYSNNKNFLFLFGIGCHYVAQARAELLVLGLQVCTTMPRLSLPCWVDRELNKLQCTEGETHHGTVEQGPRHYYFIWNDWGTYSLCVYTGCVCVCTCIMLWEDNYLYKSRFSPSIMWDQELILRLVSRHIWHWVISSAPT